MTMAALLTQRPIAPQMVAAGGDSVLVVKAHQPQLREDLATVFALPPIAGERRTVAETVEWSQGRIEHRWRHTSDVLVG